MKIRKCFSNIDCDIRQRRFIYVTKETIKSKLSYLLNQQGTYSITFLQRAFKCLDKQQKCLLDQQKFRLGLHDGKVILCQEEIEYLVRQYWNSGGVNYVNFLTDLQDTKSTRKNKQSKQNQEKNYDNQVYSNKQRVKGLEFYETKNKRSIHNTLVYKQIRRSLSLNPKYKRPFSSLLAKQLDKVKKMDSFKKQKNCILRKKVVPTGMKFWQKMDASIKQRKPKDQIKIRQIFSTKKQKVSALKEDTQTQPQLKANLQNSSRTHLKRARSVGTASTNHTRLVRVYQGQLFTMSTIKKREQSSFTYLYQL